MCAIWSAITAVILGAQYSSLCSLVPIARVIEGRWGGLHLPGGLHLGCRLLDRAARQRPAPGGTTLRRRLLWVASDLDSESLSSSQSRMGLTKVHVTAR